MVGDEVEDDADAAAMRFLDQAVHRVEIAEVRVDVTVVRDVVAEVRHRRGECRREPDRVDAERFFRAVVQVVEAVDDALQIADAVAVRVLKAARIDLVDDAMLPPHVLLDVLATGAADDPCSATVVTFERNEVCQSVS